MKLPLKKKFERANRAFKCAALVAGATFATSDIASADPLGGAIVNQDTINAGDRISYDFMLFGDELTEVDLHGDGLADLDIDLYDVNYNLVASDHSVSSNARVFITPAWTGTFHAVVSNHGLLRSHYTVRIF